jgi:4-aminobutyrate aminotransferase/(S)-3-amino-2-methylpropionate transaminase
MQAIELVHSPESRKPAEEETKQIVSHCYEHGLIVLSAGTYDNVIRLLVPLIVTEEQFEEGLDVLQAALETVCEPKPRAVSRPA